MTIILIVAVVFSAAFLQSLSGFGFAIIIMPLLTLALGLQTAAPLVALAGLTVYAINFFRYCRAINLGEVLRLGIASALGVPVGLWVLSNAEEVLVKQILGVMLIAYAIFALTRPIASWVPSRLWVYPTGFLAGCLGGAYNTPGPPAILYGSLRQWPKDEFRAVLQALFFANATLVVAAHLIARHVTAEVITFYFYAVPALISGILVGSRVDQKVDRERFRRIVTLMIVALGLSLIFTAAK
jgi:uncharacterized membrane protein YfcA